MRDKSAVKSCYNMVQYNMIFAYTIIGTEAEYQSKAKSTKDTPYLTLTGDLWDVFGEYSNFSGHQLDEPMGFSGGLRQQSIMLYFV